MAGFGTQCVPHILSGIWLLVPDFIYVYSWVAFNAVADWVGMVADAGFCMAKTTDEQSFILAIGP
jgi:hypothetical protein